MDINKIYEGNCLEVLKTFPDNSINCCITSPPYFGLRDYGTGVWVGGDSTCDHVADPNATKVFGNVEFNKNCPAREQTKTKGYYKTVCPKCGAIREDYQIGLEETPEDYIDRLLAVFMEVYRVLTVDGTCWINIGDSYVGSGSRGCNYDDFNHSQIWLQTVSKGTMHNENIPKFNTNGVYKNKDLIGVPWMLAFALRDSGWYLRQDIIWSKPNPMPESVIDRCTKSHEYVFLLTKSPRYYFDYNAIMEISKTGVSDSRFGNGRIEYDGKRTIDGAQGQQSFVVVGEKRRKRSVWNVVPSHYKEAHFATFPEELIYPMILAGCPKDGVVLDPFMGSGTTAVVAKQNHRNYIGVELNKEYIKMAQNRINGTMQRLF